MSNDLVNELLNLGPDDSGFREVGVAAATALTEARAEIERLRAVEKEKAREWFCDTLGEIGFVGIRDYAATQARALAAESELSTLRDMLILCGELGGMQPGEKMADYLRRLIDEVAGVESLRARVREVVGPFVSHFEPWMDERDPETQSSTFPRHTFAQLNAARQLMEDLK